MMNRQIKRNIIAALFGFSVFATLVPCAEAVIISPVQLDLSVKKPIGSFTVTNDSALTITYQSSALSWTQVDGKDVQIETNDLVVTPPIVSIKPKSAQVFRVALFKASPHLVEQSYRIVLDDISTDVSEKSETGLSFRFNHNLPLFYAPLISVDSVVWSLCDSHVAGKSCLLMENKGNVHAKIVQFSAVAASIEEPNSLTKTVLAGGSSQWLFSTIQGTENTTSIKLITDKGPLTLILKDLPRSK
jgi:fimbrial chaperone protein